MSCITRYWLVAIIAGMVTWPACAADADIATDWNAAVLEVAEAEDGFMTLKGLRTVTLTHLAMHDALNGSEGRYAHFLASTTTSTGSVPAAISAAYHVASLHYPDAQPRFEALLERQLQALPQSGSFAQLTARGKAIAAATIQSRADDGWAAEAEYRWHPMAPGVYAEFNEHSGTPEGFIFGAGWARATGFGFEAVQEYRAPPPPAIDGDAYARSFKEVNSLGRFQRQHRTPDQTHIALWWKDFVENSHNRLARDLIERERLDLVDAVRLLAMLNMSVFDAYVASFDNKFHYNHWRPYTAIRWADNDGNDATDVESTWTNTHRHTYAFPSYPSAHGTACSAAMTTLASVFGADYAFTMRTPIVDIAGPFSGNIEMQPATRSFASFAEAAAQCGESRVFLGIHFRYDSESGVELGRRVANNLLKKQLQPTNR